MFNYYIFSTANQQSQSAQGGGSGVTSINGATGDIMFAGVSGIFIQQQGNTLYVAHSGIQVDLTASGFITAGNFNFAGDREATWYFAEYNSDLNSFDHAFFLRQRSQISDVVLYGNSPSGNCVISLASGFPGVSPTAMYVGNSKPTINGVRQVSSGFLPDTLILPEGSILYANVESIPAGTSGIRFSVYFDMDTVTSGIQSGVMSINSVATGPNVVISGQSGIQVSAVSNQIFLNVSGVMFAGDLAGYGYTTLNAVRTDIGSSGYVRNVDLLASGYVESLNGLTKDITLVGSGGTVIWADGQTIQIFSSGGGSGITLAEVRDDIRTSGYTTVGEINARLYASGFIRNIDFVGSGFLTGQQISSMITASGYLKASDRMYPVDARAVSGHIVPSTTQSGYWNLGGQDSIFKTIYAGSGVFTSGIFAVVNGKQTFSYDLVDNGRISLTAQNPHGQTLTITSRDASHGSPSIASNANLVLSPAGDIQIVGTGKVTPITSGVIDIGTDSLIFRKVYSNSGVFDDALLVRRRRITSEYQQEWVASGPIDIASGFDGGRLIRHASEILDVACWARSPSGNVIFGLSSGAPGYRPVSLYTTNSKPITSGDYACSSGSLPNTVLIPGGTILYADIHQIPSGILSATASGACVQVFLARQTEAL